MRKHIYDWLPFEGSDTARVLTLDGRHFWAHANRYGRKWISGWTLYELDAPGGFIVMKIADDIKWSEIDRALQQYVGGA
jgi:hypothetical protein